MTTTDKPLDLAPILARCDAATAGPWEVTVCADDKALPGELGVHAPCDPRSHQKADETWHSCVIARGMDGPTSATNAEFIAAARTDVPVLVAEVQRLRADNERLTRACVEGLPREVMHCPACGVQHIEGPRHDNPALDGRVRPHHTHRCYGCGHVWDAGRWSYGDTEASVAAPLSEVQRLREIVEGRTTAPTGAEIAAHEATGGTWRTYVPNEWIFSGDLMDAEETLKVCDVQQANAVTNARWWALDASGAPTQWPVVTP